MPPAAAGARSVGIALILLGAWFLLPAVSGIELPLEQWWPLFLVAIALSITLRGNWQHGFAVGAIGGVFLLHNLDILEVDGAVLWPVVLIAAGAVMLIGRRRAGAAGGAAAGDDIDVASLFSSSNHVVTSKEFHGGNVSATFGGAEIDLRAAALDGGAATIHANAMFGGIEIRVPPGWAVDVRSSAAFGSVESRRPEPSDPEARLTVTGLCLFGGIVVKP